MKQHAMSPMQASNWMCLKTAHVPNNVQNMGPFSGPAARCHDLSLHGDM